MSVCLFACVAHSLSTYFLDSPPACLPLCLPICLLALTIYPFACLLTCLPTCQLAYRPAFLPLCLPACCLPACLPVCLSVLLSVCPCVCLCLAVFLPVCLPSRLPACLLAFSPACLLACGFFFWRSMGCCGFSAALADKYDFHHYVSKATLQVLSAMSEPHICYGCAGVDQLWKRCHTMSACVRLECGPETPDKGKSGASRSYGRRFWCFRCIERQGSLDRVFRCN